MRSARPVTSEVLDLMAEGVLDAKHIAETCLQYMSEQEVADMVRANDMEEVVRSADDNDEDEDDDEE